MRDLWVDVGHQDPWAPPVFDLHAAMQEQGWRHHWQPEPSGHDLAYWQRRLPDYVRFYRTTLEGPVTDQPVQ